MKIRKELVDNLIKETIKFYESELKKTKVKLPLSKSKRTSTNINKMTLDEFNELYLDKTVHCKTEELANEFLALAERFGYVWTDGVRLTHNNEWNIYKENTGYKLRANKKVIFGSVTHLVEFKGGNHNGV